MISFQLSFLYYFECLLTTIANKYLLQFVYALCAGQVLFFLNHLQHYVQMLI